MGKGLKNFLPRPLKRTGQLPKSDRTLRPNGGIVVVSDKPMTAPVVVQSAPSTDD